MISCLAFPLLVCTDPWSLTQPSPYLSLQTHDLLPGLPATYNLKKVQG